MRIAAKYRKANYCELLYYEGNTEEPLSKAVYVRFYLNKGKDKQENQVTHTYALIQAKSFMGVTK